MPAAARDTMNFFQMVQQATAECAKCGAKGLSLMQCPCRQVFYCDPKCQKDDWAIHRDRCTKGRKGPLTPSFCAMCGKSSTSLMSCPCENVLYCSVLCQQRHFGAHRRTCTVAVTTFRTVGRQVEDEAIMPEYTRNISVQTDESCQPLIVQAKQALKERNQQQKQLAVQGTMPKKDGKSDAAFPNDDLETDLFVPVTSGMVRTDGPAA